MLSGVQRSPRFSAQHPLGENVGTRWRAELVGGVMKAIRQVVRLW